MPAYPPHPALKDLRPGPMKVREKSQIPELVSLLQTLATGMEILARTADTLLSPQVHVIHAPTAGGTEDVDNGIPDTKS